jgi:alkylhydroperoxidase family enzyme
VTWLPALGPGPTCFERAFALRPDLHAAWRDFATLFWEGELLPLSVLELCRLRVGQMHGAYLPDLCPKMGKSRASLAPGKAASLEAWWQSDAYSATERAALRFAEQFVLDPKGISDEDAAAVVSAFGDAATVAFVELLAILDGFSRFARILGVGADPGGAE